MATYEQLNHLGIELKNSDINTLSIEQLYKILRRATNAHQTSTLKHYAKMLRDGGFIEFENGLWKIKKGD